MCLSARPAILLDRPPNPEHPWRSVVAQKLPNSTNLVVRMLPCRSIPLEGRNDVTHGSEEGLADVTVLPPVPGKEVFDQRRYDGVVVARHGREEMVLELILHAAPQPLRERITADCVTSRSELALDKLRVFVEEYLLTLVRNRRDRRLHSVLGFRVQV